MLQALATYDTAVFHLLGHVESLGAMEVKGSGYQIDPWMSMLICFSVPVGFFLFIYLINRYRRCPSNRILVVYGKVGRDRKSKCIHGGGAYILPVIQDYMYLSLKPMQVEMDLKEALPVKALTFDMPKVYHLAISTEPQMMENAAERILGMREEDIAAMTQGMMVTQAKLLAADKQAKQINEAPQDFLKQLHQKMNQKLAEFGLILMNTD